MIPEPELIHRETREIGTPLTGQQADAIARSLEARLGFRLDDGAHYVNTGELGDGLVLVEVFRNP